MDYMKCWMNLKNSLLDTMAVEEKFSIRKETMQEVLNDMASIEVAITLGEEYGEC